MRTGESQQTFLSTKSARHAVPDNAVPAAPNLGPDADCTVPRPPGHVRNLGESENRKFRRFFNLFYLPVRLVAFGRPRWLTFPSGVGSAKVGAVPDG